MSEREIYSEIELIGVLLDLQAEHDPPVDEYDIGYSEAIDDAIGAVNDYRDTDN